MQCECCSSCLGDKIKLEHTERIICDDCLGFMARWLIELENEPCPPVTSVSAPTVKSTIQSGLASDAALPATSV